MYCRKNIKGRKIWVDGGNAYNTRPDSVEITLYRDGVPYNTVTLDSLSDGDYRFPCLIVWKNAAEKYVYTVDETTPDGYTKKIQGYNIINTLNEITIGGTKRWDDNADEEGNRPQQITLHLLRNSVEIDTMQVDNPVGIEDTVEFDFGVRPFADENGVPYFYEVVEEPVQYYEAVKDGFNITNVYHSPITP